MKMLRSSVQLKAWLVAVGLVVSISACSDSEPEPTVEERLVEIAGEPLTPIEVAKQLETADNLCQLDDELLLRMWPKLDPQQFAFQEFVFNHHCPDRSLLIEEYVPPATSSTTTTLQSAPGDPTTSGPASESTDQGSTTTSGSSPGSSVTSGSATSSSVTVSSSPGSSITAGSVTSTDTTTTTAPRFGAAEPDDPNSTRIGEGG